jgi:hypothetical protein
VQPLKSLRIGWSIARAIAQSDSVKEMRNRALRRLGNSAARVARNERVPKFIAAPAEVLAAVLAIGDAQASCSLDDFEPDEPHRGQAAEPATIPPPSPDANGGPGSIQHGVDPSASAQMGADIEAATHPSPLAPESASRSRPSSASVPRARPSEKPTRNSEPSAATSAEPSHGPQRGSSSPPQKHSAGRKPASHIRTTSSGHPSAPPSRKVGTSERPSKPAKAKRKKTRDKNGAMK